MLLTLKLNTENKKKRRNEKFVRLTPHLLFSGKSWEKNQDDFIKCTLCLSTNELWMSTKISLGSSYLPCPPAHPVFNISLQFVVTDKLPISKFSKMNDNFEC
jgi:hypothetical protein